MLSSMLAADEARRKSALNGTDRMSPGSGPYPERMEASPALLKSLGYNPAPRAPTAEEYGNLVKHLYMAPPAGNMDNVYAGPGAIAPQYADGGIIKKGLGALAAMAKTERPGITAYHGSPHSFDRFDMSKIGTGEGAQAYGHGLYFAGNEEVARSYRNLLSRDAQFQYTKPDGAVATIWTHLPNRVTDEIGLGKDRMSYPAQHALTQMRLGMSFDNAISDMRKNYPQFHANDLETIESKLRQANPSVIVSDGHMYKVGIDADPERLLDWDAPLRSNPKVLDDVVNKFGSADLVRQKHKEFDQLSSDVLAASRLTGERAKLQEQWDLMNKDPATRVGNLLNQIDKPANSFGYDPSAKVTGKDLYRALSAGNQAKATDELREVGVPGIKYLDGMSRSAGEGSRNYVVFDDGLVNIEKKYADGGMIKRGAGALSSFFAKGKPEIVKIPGVGEVPAAEIPAIQDAARSYMQARGLGSHRVDEYPKHSPEFGREIGRAFDEMPHAPRDPAVKRSYEALMDETLDQYKALKGSGIDFKFLKDGQADPYAASPSLGYHDIQKNGRLWVFPTDQGYGTQADIADNPLLKRVGRVGDLPNATANDAFRVVHDAYGHFGPGNPFFRGPGEDRAWLNHSRMFSEDAKPAMSSETRGQNSWVNYGPQAAANKNASGADTIYADQKAGIMPAWTRAESPLQAADMMRSEDRERALQFLKSIEGKGYKDGGRPDADAPMRTDYVGYKLPQLGDGTPEGDYRAPTLDADAPMRADYGTIRMPRLPASLPKDPLPEDVAAWKASNASIDKQSADIQSMTHRPSEPRRPVVVDLPYIGETKFGSAPYSVAGPMGTALSGAAGLAHMGSYMTPIGPYVAGADAAHALAKGDALGLGLSALGLPGRALKGVTIGTAASLPDGADASFIGRNSLNWAKGRADRALDMLNKGLSKDEVWQATGTMRDPFTHVLKQEISDHLATFKPGAIEALKSGKTLTVPDVIDHPEWTDGYLSYLSKIPVSHDKKLGDARGSFDGSKIAIDINQPEHMLMDTFLHEGQHAIAKREGWLGGSNLSNHTKYGDLEHEVARYNIVDDFKNWSRENGRNIYSMDTMADYRATLPPDMVDRTYGLGPLLSKPDDVLDAARLKALQEMGPVKSRYDAYRRHPGEDEAHNVGDRLAMTPDERRMFAPWETAYVQDGFYTRNPGESFQNDRRHIVEREKRQAQK
jgi:hypothetical protein